MRIYFLSERTAALKLDGAYLGLIGGFEKFVDVNGGEKILAEAVPEGDFLPLNFFISPEFFSAPPEFADVYLIGADAVIYLARYERRGRELKVVAQTQFCGGRYTLFLNGGRIYLNCERDTCTLTELSSGFENATFKEDVVGGYPVLLVEGKGCLAVISEDGRRVFYNPAESWQCGDKLTAEINFNTCAGCKAVCTFAYDGREMTLENSLTREYMPPNDEILHFAFFECVLTRGDFAKYLCDGLKKKAGDLPAYLGEFIDVTLPYKKFFDRHGNIRAAGLVYPVLRNLFKVKYFAVDLEEGKITNVYEVED